MMKRIKQFIMNSDLDLRERIMRMGVIFVALLLLLGIAEGEILNIPRFINIVRAVMLVLTLCCALLAYLKKTEMAIFAVGFVMIGLVFPGMFFLSGGLESGASVWFVLGLFYLFMMYSGRRLVSLLVLVLLEYMFIYVIAYLHPDYVIKPDSRQNVYGVSAFAVFTVGMSIGLLLKYQLQQFEKERQIAKAQSEELEVLGRSRNQFFANISHEIRTPINTIIGLNEVILRDNISEEVAENAVNIQNASKMLLSIVNDILDISQMEMHKMEIIPVVYSTKGMFSELVDMIRMRMKEKGLNFIVNIDGDLPAKLCGDEKRIKQVVLNLLTNAVKYTESGSVTLTVHGDMLGEEWLRLTIVVSDTGIGIHKGDLANLFESFSRLDGKTNHKVEGTGLGLAICKQLVDLMGGQITVDSIYTKGSDFTVILEQQIIERTPIGAVNFFAANHEGYRQYYRQSFEAPEARILIVDDSDMNRLVAEKLLRPTKVQIDTVASGEECLELTRTKRYQVILMDHMMSGMDGVETLNAIRTQEYGLCRETPVIAMTANSMPGVDAVYQKYGFQGYLEKPIQSERLEEEVLRYIPEELVEYRMASPVVHNFTDMIESVTGRNMHKKRKSICITTDSVCDMSSERLRQLDVRVMYLYITTEHGRFRDTKEITSDNLTQHLSPAKSTAYADSATIEEFEDFFAQTLAEAEEIIHISMAAKTGRTYNIARQAARSFGHVHVIDSGQVSSGEALVVMHAAQLVEDGKDVAAVCEDVERFVRRIRTSFILPTSSVFYQQGYTSQRITRLCSRFNLHPVLHMDQSRLKIVCFLHGAMERSWKTYIRLFFLNKSKVDPEIVYIAHAGLSMRQLGLIESEIKKYVRFQKVVIEKASVSTACNSGLGTFGIAYLRK